MYLRFSTFLVLCIIIYDFKSATALYGDTVRLAKENEFPFAVCILNKNYAGSVEDKITCTGSLISREYVLTAAHCLDEGADNLQVVVGSVDVRNGEKYDVFGGIEYTKWAKDKGVDILFEINDIAILKLRRKVENRNQKVTVLSIKKRYELEGKMATIAGWGVLQDASPSRYLRVASVQIMNAEQCEKRIRIIKNLPHFSLPANILCTDAKSATLARGDSGGPLFMKENKLIGVNIMGCFESTYADPNQQNIHLTVDYYKFFINDILKNGHKYNWLKRTAHEEEFNAASCLLYDKLPFTY